MDTLEKAILISGQALDRKAYDLVLLQVGEITSIADYFIICSGRSDRQVHSIAQGIEENIKKEGISPIAVEGVTRGQWVLMDYADVIVHVFYQPLREFYDLEGLWSHALQVDLPEPYLTLVNQFSLKTSSVT